MEKKTYQARHCSEESAVDGMQSNASANYKTETS